MVMQNNDHAADQTPASGNASDGDSQPGWEYKKSDSENQESSQPEEDFVPPVSWSASEYMHHEKGFGWFAMSFGVVVLATAFIYFITKDVVSTVAVAVIGMAFVAFAGRRPQILEYSVDGQGVHIAHKLYPYDHFKSFLLLEDQAVPTVILQPSRRLGLPVTIHFEPADADKILEVLGSHLPGEANNAPPVDRLMSKLRF